MSEQRGGVYEKNFSAVFIITLHYAGGEFGFGRTGSC